MQQRLFQSTLNTRDLGGYPITQSTSTRFHQLIRSDVPSHLEAHEIQILLDLNITTIIDLRSSEEWKHAPCYLQAHPDFHYHHCNLYGNGGSPRVEDDIPLSYFEMTACHDAICTIMKLIASAPSGILYHCTVGKDRTGVLSALLLALVGVPISSIVADYEVSSSYLQPIITKLHQENPDLPSFIGQSKATYIENFFTLFVEKYNTVEAYLLSLGLSEEDICAIKSRLIEKK